MLFLSMATNASVIKAKCKILSHSVDTTCLLAGLLGDWVGGLENLTSNVVDADLIMMVAQRETWDL